MVGTVDRHVGTVQWIQEGILQDCCIVVLVSGQAAVPFGRGKMLINRAPKPYVDKLDALADAENRYPVAQAVVEGLKL